MKTKHLSFLHPSSKVKVLVAQLRVTAMPWTAAHQAPLSMEFSRQEYWSGLPFPSPGDLLNPGTEAGLLHCRQILYLLSPQGSYLLSIFAQNPHRPVAWFIPLQWAEICIYREKIVRTLFSLLLVHIAWSFTHLFLLLAPESHVADAAALTEGVHSVSVEQLNGPDQPGAGAAVVQVAVRLAVVDMAADEALLVAEQDHDLQHRRDWGSTRVPANPEQQCGAEHQSQNASFP